MTDDEQHDRITAQAGVEATSKIDDTGAVKPVVFDEPKITQDPDPSVGGTPLPPSEAPYSKLGEMVDEMIGLPKKPRAKVKVRHREACTLPSDPLPLNPDFDARELYHEVKRHIDRRTNLPDRVSAIVAFWAISTWFPSAFNVFPCLVITGRAHEAMAIVRVLEELCCAPTTVTGFRRSDLYSMRGIGTLLILEPNLNDQTAALLGNLTYRGVMLVEQGSRFNCAGSRAIYIGENPAIKRISNSIVIDATSRTHANTPVFNQSVTATVDILRNRMAEYGERNLTKVRCLEFDPRGLSLEAHAVANALGSCVIDAPELQMALVDLLRAPDREQIAERADSTEALVAKVALTFSHQGKEQVFVKEITAEVNRVLEAREAGKLTPEKIGHVLKRIGLPTRRLSHAGNGLNMDQETTNRIHEVADSYHSVEDCLEEDANLHCPLCQKNERRGKDM